MRTLLAAFCSLFLIGQVCSAATKGVATGNQAPEFSATDANGGSKALKDYKGKIVVLEWFNHGCPFVKKHYNSGNMQRLQKEFTDKGVIWLTINSSAEGKQGHVTPEEAVALMKEKGGASTAFLLDPKGDVGRLYGARTTPHMFVIDKEGKVVYQGAIDDDNSTDPDSIPQAKNYVREVIGELLSGKAVSVASTEPYGCAVKYES